MRYSPVYKIPQFRLQIFENGTNNFKVETDGKLLNA